jgi:hypothetical protein
MRHRGLDSVREHRLGNEGGVMDDKDETGGMIGLKRGGIGLD